MWRARSLSCGRQLALAAANDIELGVPRRFSQARPDRPLTPEIDYATKHAPDTSNSGVVSAHCRANSRTTPAADFGHAVPHLCGAPCREPACQTQPNDLERPKKSTSWMLARTEAPRARNRTTFRFVGSDFACGTVFSLSRCDPRSPPPVRRRRCPVTPRPCNQLAGTPSGQAAELHTWRPPLGHARKRVVAQSACCGRLAVGMVASVVDVRGGRRGGGLVGRRVMP